MEYDVLIATPGEQLSSGYVRSLLNTVDEFHKRGITYKWLNNYGSLSHNTRECILTNDGTNLNPNHRGPLGDKCNYKKVFWIDSNISWTPRNLLALYDSQHPIVTGAYLKTDGSSTIVINGKLLRAGDIKKLSGVVKIDSTELGFLAFSKGVLEATGRPWFNIPPAYPNEDRAWCAKMARYNIPIYLDTQALVNRTSNEELLCR